MHLFPPQEVGVKSDPLERISCVIQALAPQAVNNTSIASYQPHSKSIIRLFYVSDCPIYVCFLLSRPISVSKHRFPRYQYYSFARYYSHCKIGTIENTYGVIYPPNLTQPSPARPNDRSRCLGEILSPSSQCP
jgi:hypothetical protein